MASAVEQGHIPYCKGIIQYDKHIYVWRTARSVYVRPRRGRRARVARTAVRANTYMCLLFVAMPFLGPGHALHPVLLLMMLMLL